MPTLCQYAPSRCMRGTYIVDSADPNDNLVFPISIAKSVGAHNSPNIVADVITIQKALNRIAPDLGGPLPKLVLDGKVGRLTLGAINKFQQRQLGFSDSRIEPGRKTINRINDLELTVWVTVNPRTISKIYDELMPVVLRCILASDAALQLAERSLFSPSSGLNPGQTAAAMVNRHFSLDRNPNARNDFDLIRRIVRNMLVLLHRNQNGGEKTFVAAPGRFSAARMIRSGVLALAFPHGVATNGFSKGQAQDGSDIEVPNNKIMIAIPFAFTTRDSQLITLIHEMAHFLGGPDGSAELIDDPPGGRSAPSEIAKLPPERMAHIAENYATFAFESAFRRPPIRMLV